MNSTTRNAKPEIGPDRSSQTRGNPWVAWYGAGFGPQTTSGVRFWTVLEPNWTIFPVQTPTAGRLPGPIANTSRWVGPSPRREAFITFHELGYVHSSEDWGAHGAQVWHLLHSLRNSEGHGLDKLPVNMDMTGRGVCGRSGAGGGSGMSWGSSTGGSGTATGASGGSRSTVFSWHLGTVCSGLAMGWWIRRWICSNWWSKVNR